MSGKTLPKEVYPLQFPYGFDILHDPGKEKGQCREEYGCCKNMTHLWPVAKAKES